uniref:Uncharacterized protein n=1 Tax=Arundo donax TaxID=35708 RepID=A0A0A9AM98_ARUDO
MRSSMEPEWLRAREEEDEVTPVGWPEERRRGSPMGLGGGGDRRERSVQRRELGNWA